MILLPHCGYHHEHHPDLETSYRTISVPYFIGDDKGLLTDAVIKALSVSGAYICLSKDGDLTLKGEITQDTTQQIGYQYDKEITTGERINRLIPNEGRAEMSVRISIVDTTSGKTVYGPFNVNTSSDFDFVNTDSVQSTSFIDAAGSRQSVLFFSLGQLDSEEGAQDISSEAVNKNLSKKIAEGVKRYFFK